MKNKCSASGMTVFGREYGSSGGILRDSDEKGKITCPACGKPVKLRQHPNGARSIKQIPMHNKSEK